MIKYIKDLCMNNSEKSKTNKTDKARKTDKVSKEITKVISYINKRALCKSVVCIMLTIIMTVLPIFGAGSKMVYAESRKCRTIQVITNGTPYLIRGVDVDYPHNTYVSLLDMAVMLRDTGRQFAVGIGSPINIYPGGYQESDIALTGWSDDERNSFSGKNLAINDINVNDEPRRYYTVIASYSGKTDAYISLIDLAMLLDFNLSSDSEGNITIDTNSPLVVNPGRLESEGFFYGLNSVLVGDATTGEIFYGYNEENIYPIASITKIMTYLLTMDSISAGRITENDLVTISDNAEELSKGADGIIPMNSGHQATVSDLIKGALLPSSNECAYTLAEYIAGDETTFVKMMNDKATELSMDTAVFYNSNGLPSYDTAGLSAKRQNVMSSHDMFKLASHIVNTYPQVKEVTSMKTAGLTSFGLDVKNTNALLYNMPEANGLKTGTTDKSGCCLVSIITINGHDIVVVELGAENSLSRTRVSEVMARYGKGVVLGIAGKNYNGNVSNPEIVIEEITSESIVKLIVNGAIKKKQGMQ